MKTNTSNSKNIGFFSRITGASSEILSKCSPGCQNAFSYVGMTIVFTAIVSAVVIAFGVSTYSFKSMAMFPVIFIVWILFIYLFDRMVLLSDSNITKFVRVCAIIVLALFHSFIFDTLTLKDDIFSLMKKEYNIKVDSVQTKNQALIIPIQIKIDSLQNNNTSINSKKRSFMDSLQAEARGNGKSHYGIGEVYTSLEKLKGEYNAMAANDIATNDTSIAQYKNDISVINADKKTEIAAIVKPGEAGLMEQVRKMHELVFVHGTFTEQLFFGIWFAIFCFLESLPVLAKLVFQKQLREYFIGQDKEQENYIKGFEKRKIYDWSVIETELLYDLNFRIAKVTADSFINKIEQDKQIIMTRLNMLKEFLGELDRIEAELKRMFPNHYTAYVEPEIDKSLRNFIKSMNANS